VSERYAFIRAEKAGTGFPVRRGCRLLEVSASGYYAWHDRAPSATAARRAEVAVLAAEAHAASDGTHGYRRVHRDLAEAGVACSWKLVRRAMREQNLAGAQPAAFRVTTRQDPDAKAAPDLIRRDFTSQEPGTKLVGDITYIRTWAGWAYLAVVIDLATKMVVGWQLGNRATAQLSVDALEMADRNGHLEPDAIFHSDRGCQGGFKWSSQRLDLGGVDGQAGWVDDRAYGAVGDEVAWGSVASAGGRAPVLARDREGAARRGGRARGWGVAGGRRPVVSSRWRDASDRSGSIVGPLLVVPGA
jgi:putative transposase